MLELKLNLDGGGGLMGVYVSELTKMYTLQFPCQFITCAFYCILYFSKAFAKKGVGAGQEDLSSIPQ